MQNQKLAAALRLSDVRPFESMWMQSEKDLAQRALAGRTHYADDSTLRFFSARINETRQDDNGLWFALRESLEMPGKGRVHRWCMFDIFGQCERTEERSTGAGADKLFAALRDGIEWEARTMDELERRAVRARDESQQILDALAL